MSGRGRGRGGRGGRGRSRGGRGGARSSGSSSVSVAQQQQYEADFSAHKANIPGGIIVADAFPEWTWHSIRELLLSESKPEAHLRYHVSAIRSQPLLYSSHVRHMISQQVHLGWTVVMKARILAASLSVKGKKDLAQWLLKSEGLISLAEVLRAVQWLDSSRAIRQVKTKIAAMAEQQQRDELREAMKRAAAAESSSSSSSSSSKAAEKAKAAGAIPNPQAQAALQVPAEREARKKVTALTKLRTLLTSLELEAIVNDDKEFRQPAVIGKNKRRSYPARPGGVSFSGNKAIFIRKWANSFSPSTLSYFLLNYPKDPWRNLSDLVHFKPSDFQLPFFLASIYDAEPPEGSMCFLAQTATKANLAARIEANHDLAACYSFFRTHFKDARTKSAEDDASIAEIVGMGFSRKAALLARQQHPGLNPDAIQSCVDWIIEHTVYIEAAADPSIVADADANSDFTRASKAAFGKYAPLEDCLWYYEELECPEVEQALHARLAAGEQMNPSSPRSNYGKLMERILLCRARNVSFWQLLVPLADKRLELMKEQKKRMTEGMMRSTSAAAVAPASQEDALAMMAGVAVSSSNASTTASSSTVASSSTSPSSSSCSSSSTSSSAAPYVPNDGSKGSVAAKVAVLGDKSGSMEVAVRSASSLGALLSAVLDAELSFFNTVASLPPVQPRTASETLRVIDSTLANGGTSMAAALLPYYKAKKKIDLFILVSDEGENVEAEGNWFAGLWKKYKEEIHPESKLFLVSFLPNDTSIVGTIKERLNAIGLGGDAVMQYRFDVNRPDTTKFDILLGILSLDIELINERKKRIREHLLEAGVPNVLHDIVSEY